jgi:hypothetical protein
MQFSKEGEFYKASRVTGPRHNLLFLSFITGDNSASPIIGANPAIGDCSHSPLDKQQILSAVLEGVRLANHQLGTDYQVAMVRYVENDTPPEITYSYLAFKLIEYIEGNHQLEASKES